MVVGDLPYLDSLSKMVHEMLVAEVVGKPEIRCQLAHRRTLSLARLVPADGAKEELTNDFHRILLSAANPPSSAAVVVQGR